MTAWALLAFGYHLLSRLAYVLGVGWMLLQQERHQFFTRRYGAPEGFRRFRRLASSVMNNDAASFVLLCIVTRRTLPLDLPLEALIAAGILLILLGVTIKLWAASRLGSAGYHWHNFFEPGDWAPPDPPGPYRFLKNPMYTLGYLHAYGFALATGSLLGLIAAALDQAAILAFNRLVEKPHFERLASRIVPAGSAAPGRNNSVAQTEGAGRGDS